MTHADPDALKALLPLLRQLREIKGLREVKPGVFHNRGVAFLHFHDSDGVLMADLKKAGGGGFDRYKIATAPEQRKLVDDARRRAGRGDDD
jgi:hypothetical protein